MDQFLPLYDNTASQSFVNLEAPQSGLSQTETHAILQQLMSSIDLHKLASLYYGQLKQRLNLQALSIRFSTGCLTIGEMAQASNVKSLELMSQHQPIATLQYGFNGVLTLRESAILNELHRLAKYPLKHALEHLQIKQLAMKDHLTSLGNRANYEETVGRLISQFNRNGENFGLLVIDMDNFKQVNDKFGHQEGDNVLIAAAECLTQSLRDTDFAFRFGGDEFCCLLPTSNEDNNGMIAQRIQRQFSQHPLLVRHGVSCSIGCTVFGDKDSPNSLFERADQALYSAKQNGRSCCIAA